MLMLPFVICASNFFNLMINVNRGVSVTEFEFVTIIVVSLVYIISDQHLYLSSSLDKTFIIFSLLSQVTFPAFLKESRETWARVY